MNGNWQGFDDPDLFSVTEQSTAVNLVEVVVDLIVVVVDLIVVVVDLVDVFI